MTVLWAAKTFYPDLFADVDVVAEARSFYQRFFNTALTGAQVQEIVSGRVGVP